MATNYGVQGVQPPAGNRRAKRRACTLARRGGSAAAKLTPLFDVASNQLAIHHVAAVWQDLLSGMNGRLQWGSHQPCPNFRVSTTDPGQGDTIAVMVRVPPPDNVLAAALRAGARLHAGGDLVSVTWEGTRVPCFPCTPAGSGRADGKRRAVVWRAFVATTPLDSSRDYTLEVRVNDGLHRPAQAHVFLRERVFPTEHIWLPEGRRGAVSDPAASRRVDVALTHEAPEQHWSGRFRDPVDPKLTVVTTPYGSRRYYNGTFREGYYHGGVDLAADTGTPVTASEAGRVVLAAREEEGFAVEGNCVVIDHGHGVTSLYAHLDSLNVDEGDVVKAGDLVGAMGNTGASTGPHLHYSLFVHGRSVDPAPWMASLHNDEHVSNSRPPWAC
ncbi:peptidase family M23 [Pycnococcus provasolii]